MARTIPKGIVKDVIIVGIAVLVIWIGLQVAFGTPNPFYVVVSGSMIPVLEIYDVLVVSGHVSFDDIEVGDIIVFNRPSDHDRVIVHRVASIIDDDPKTVRTKGDANPASIPGTDFPITEEEYIGEVVYAIPQVGYITQLIKPPINYIIIAIVIGIMVAKQFVKKKPSLEESDSADELADIGKMGKDSEYITEEDDKESDDIAKTAEIDEKMEGIDESISKDADGDSK